MRLAVDPAVSSKSRRWPIVALAAALGALGLLVFMGLPRLSQPAGDASPTIAANTSTEAKPAPAGDGARSANLATHARHKHSHAVSKALQLDGPDYLEFARHWYAAPQTDSKGLFAATRTPIVADASCSARNEIKFATLESAIQAGVGVQSTQPLPMDALVQQVTQFWQLNGWYYQLSAAWDKDIPATYRVHYLRSREPAFGGEIERLPLQASDGIDAPALAQLLDSMPRTAEAQGATRGARIVHLLLAADDGDALQDMKILNGRPTSWMFGYGHCRTRNDGVAFCKCTDPATAHSHETAQHRVID
jgi:hypothetical protein